MADKGLALGAAGGAALLALLLKQFAMRRRKRPLLTQMPIGQMTDLFLQTRAPTPPTASPRPQMANATAAQASQTAPSPPKTTVKASKPLFSNLFDNCSGGT